jgi:hypothetical protein
LEWKGDDTFALAEGAVSNGHFQLIKPDERLADLIADNLLSESSKKLKGFSSTNRLINKKLGESFIKDWEVFNELKLITLN